MEDLRVADRDRTPGWFCHAGLDVHVANGVQNYTYTMLAFCQCLLMSSP
jgi:hypothetical protein